MTETLDQIVYRDLANQWGAFRLQIDGVNVTTVGGAPAQIGGYQLTEPYGYGPADFAFPQVTSRDFHTYSWLDLGKQVRLVQVDETDSAVRLIWRGFISTMTPTVDGTDIHCDGWASGRLANIPHHPRLWHLTKDVGAWLYDAFLRAGLSSSPAFGVETGIEIDPRDISGTELSYCDELLARTLQADGTSLSVYPDPDSDGFIQAWKDLDTVHFSAFEGAAGQVLNVTRDLMEEPTTVYGQGREPASDDDEGILVWVNRKDPGLKQGVTPTFPGSMSLGDSSDAVNTLQRKLVGTGYLSRRDALGGFNEETEDAVKALQEDAKLPQTGVVNSATWDALFDIDDTGLDLRQSFIMPLAEITEVRKWVYSSNGFKKGPNPDYDPDRIEVGIDWDFGTEKKARARRIAKRHVQRIQAAPCWVGTLTLGTDVIYGDHGHGSAPEGIMSRLDVVPGMNVNVRNFGADGSTKFHIATVDVDSDLNVTCKIDTKGRNALAVMQIIEANAESRRNPARQWERAHRGTDANHAVVEFSETGGEIYNEISCPADTWTVFPVVAGQSGSVNRFQLQAVKSKTEFVTAITAKKVAASWYNSKVGNPFDDKTPVQSLTLNAGGSGYIKAPTVTISGGGGSGAKAVAEIEGGAVVEVRLTQRGTGYTSAPSVSFSGGGGSGASASASLGATGSGRWTDNFAEDIESRLLLFAAGDIDQPCGYGPDGRKFGDDTDADGNPIPTGDPVTGLFVDSGGFDYWTFEQPVLWVAIYPRNACKLKPQRVLWPVLEAGT